VSKSERRPATALELARGDALNGCSLLPYSSEKRFIRSMTPPEISEKQARWLERLAWRYRRQLRAHGHADLVPADKPPAQSFPPPVPAEVAALEPEPAASPTAAAAGDTDPAQMDLL
jgi:hypothetical protein